MIDIEFKGRVKAGFTLIEMMIFIFIFSVTAITFYQSFVAGTKAMSNVKSRLDALAIANEKMEIIHNLDYEKIGTSNGIVNGEIADNESILQDNRTYWVHTTIVYVDDPFDGTAIANTDQNPNDYKQIKIQVYWENNNPSKSISLVSTIVPPGIESIYTGGILSLHVVDNAGNGIAGAAVNITNNSVSPNINVNMTTDSSGNLFLIEAPAANATYHISVAKSGYFPVQTYAPYPFSTVWPVDVNASVVEGNINQKTIVTDRISSLKIVTQTPLGETIPNVDFSLSGGRKIADTFGNDSTIVYAYNSQTSTTDNSGSVTLNQMSSGPYFFTLGNTASNNYEFLQAQPFSAVNNTFEVKPNSDAQEKIILADKSLDSLLVTVVDHNDSSPIADAKVEMKDPNSAYDVTLQTNNFGQAYFPDQTGPLSKTTYDLSVTADGYANAEKSVLIDKLTKQQIELTAN